MWLGLVLISLVLISSLGCINVSQWIDARIFGVCATVILNKMVISYALADLASYWVDNNNTNNCCFDLKTASGVVLFLG